MTATTGAQREHRHGWRHAAALASAVLLVLLPTTGNTAQLALSDVPLHISSFVEPNIMFLIDNSASMSNVVPDSPYDSSTNYTPSGCGATITQQGATTNTINLVIVSSAPQIRVGSSTAVAITALCFDSNISYLAKLNADATSGCSGGESRCPSGYLPAEYTGNYLNWYFSATNNSVTWTNELMKPSNNVKTRMTIAKESSTGLLNSLNTSAVRVGLASYNGSDGAVINQSMGSISTTLSTMTTQINALTPSGSTPLAESLRDIGEYFAVGQTGDLIIHPGKSTANGDPYNQSTVSKSTLFSRTGTGSYTFTPPNTAPIQYFCQKNFAVLITDGRPRDDQRIGSALADYDGDCLSGCDTYDRKPSQTYETNGSDYLDDVALALQDIDLRPDLNDFNGNSVKNNITTYTVGFADDQVINDPLMQDTANNGGGLFLTARNASQLTTALTSALTSISGKTGSAAAVAVNSRSLNTNTRLYQARFVSGEWRGQILAKSINSAGAVSDVNDWVTSPATPPSDAGEVLKGQDWNTGRKILTRNGSQGIAFRWPTSNADPASQADLQATELSFTQVTALKTNPATSTADPATEGEKRLEYVRGRHTYEQRNGGTYRNRPNNFKLGDIIDSAPIFVGPPPYLPELESVAHSTYRTQKTNRKQMLYVGANDGMLHGFSVSSGREEIAYVPSMVFSNLNQLTNPSYSHRFFVNGAPTAGDAYFGGAWHTMLVSGLGKGGKGYFALDISDPDGTDTSTLAFSEANAANIVKWEFIDSATPSDMGFSFGQPTIARMANGEWAAIFGNGYNSVSENAVLYIVNIGTGTIIKKLDLGNSPSNGLSTPTVVDVDGDYIADTIYAGDLKGNLWKIDVSATNTNSWGSTFKTGTTPLPMFTAVNASGLAQPITVRPEVGKHPGGQTGYMVYFGTGKYLEPQDNAPPATAPANPLYTFYGIWDKGSTQVARADLLPQTLGTGTVDPDGNAATANDITVRSVTNNTIAWRTGNSGTCGTSTGDTCLGWRVDLNYASNGDKGERSVTNPVLLGGEIPRVIFTTLVPNSTACSFGGESWLLELNPTNGGRVNQNYIDVNGDGVFDGRDLIGGTTVAAGIQLGIGIGSEPAIIYDSGNKKILKPVSGSTGQIAVPVNSSGNTPSGRQSWRQLQ